MKKLLLTLLAFIAIGTIGYAQRSIDMKIVNKALHPQSIRATRNDIAPAKAVYHTNEDAYIEYRDSFNYDENEYYLSNVQTEYYDLGYSYPYAITTYDYDFNLMPIKIIRQIYDYNEDLINDTKTELQYSDDVFNPVLVEELFQRWDNNNWVNVRKQTYTYDPDLCILVRDWNGNSFENHYLYTIYDEGESQTILLQYWLGGAWQNQEKVEIKYNDNHEIVQSITFQWVSEAWSNDLKVEYFYDGLYKLSEVTKTLWDNGQWNANKVKTIKYEYDWMGSKHALCTSNYGGPNELNTDIEMFYNEGNSITYENITEISMDYIDVTQVSETATVQFHMAPNPASDLVEISGERFQKAELYSLTGQKLLESPMPSINVKGLATGTYIIKVYQDNGAVEVQKVVVR